MNPSDRAVPHCQARPRNAFLLLVGLLGCLLLLAALGCNGGGTGSSGDHGGQLNGPYKIEPSTATVIAGRSMQFTASSPWGSAASWSVLPAAGGSIDAAGLFTAASAPGEYLIVAMWNSDVRYTATAFVAVVPQPPPARLNTGLIQAFGHNLQSTPGSGIRHATVGGELVPAQKAEGDLEGGHVRHGFYPPPVR
jgi:hypothetical protein